MSISIGPFEFDYVRYDAEADVLYLSMGEPREGYGKETPEGHFLRYDENDEFYGVTLIDVQYLLDANDGRIKITLPVEESVDFPTGELQFA